MFVFGRQSTVWHLFVFVNVYLRVFDELANSWFVYFWIVGLCYFVNASLHLCGELANSWFVFTILLCQAWYLLWLLLNISLWNCWQKDIIGNGNRYDLWPVIHYAFIYSHLALAFSVVKMFSDFIIAKGYCDHQKISRKKQKRKQSPRMKYDPPNFNLKAKKYSIKVGRQIWHRNEKPGELSPECTGRRVRAP